MKEREISLLDLLVEILLQWRRIILWMLAGAVLFGVFSYVQSYHLAWSRKTEAEPAGERSEPEQDDIKMLENSLTDEQILSVQNVIAYEKLYQDEMTYQRESVLMQIDPNKVQKAELTFCIIADDSKKSGEAERVYEDLVQSGELRAYVAEQTDSKVSDLEGVISLSRGSGGLLKGSATFQVKILHYEKNMCRQIAQALISFLTEKHKMLDKDLDRMIGKHEIAVISESYAETVDRNILDYQKKSISDNNAMKTAVAQYVGAFTPEEQAYYEYLTETDDYAGKNKNEVLTETDAHTGTVPGVSMRYILLGMMLAAFVYLFFLFLRYVLSTRIRAVDNLQELYGIVQLGTIPAQGAQERRFGFVDRWMISLRNRGSRMFTPKEALELAAAAVRMAAVKGGLQTVSMVTCGRKEAVRSVCRTIKNMLEQENIQVNILESVLYDAGTMHELERAEGAVLVEQAGYAFYSEIAQEIELLQRMEIPVLGGILTE